MHTATLNTPKIIGRANNTDLIIQVSENDRTGVYSLYFGNHDPILDAAEDARTSDREFESVDDLFDDLNA